MKLLLFAFLALPFLAATAGAADYFLFVGTYTNQNSKGIYAWRFEANKGTLAPVGLVAETPSPSFLAVHPNQRFLYAVNEVSKEGTVTAFSIDRASGKLTALNTVSSRGAGPCHLALDKTGRSLIVANYGSGSVAAYRIAQDGRLSEATAFIQHSGDPGPVTQRQAGPHAHCVAISPDNRFALVADLGLDRICVYRLDAAKASLVPNNPPFAKTAPGAGPRHLAFHPNGRWFYSINELASTITAFSYASGALHLVENFSTLPKDFKGQSTTAEIAVAPSGKFVYGSNRGDDSIAVFAVDPSKGTLTSIQHIPTQGKTPRNFALDPTGAYLFAANQQSNNIVLFKIDLATGRLTPAGTSIDAPTPVSLVFVPSV